MPRTAKRTKYGDVISPKCRDAIDRALAAGKSVEEIADDAGVNPTTLRRARMGETLTAPSRIALEAWAMPEGEARHG